MVSNEEVADADRKKCQILNNSMQQIVGWLDVKLKNGRYSHGFLVELVVNSFDRYFDIHSIYDELGKLERTDLVPSITKAARQMRGPLRGFWHKHYSQASFLPRNLRDEADQMSKDGRWHAMLERTLVDRYTRSLMRSLTRW